MAIRATDLQFYGLKNDGTLGSRISSNVLNNLMPSLTGVQNRDLATTTYVVGILNNHASLALTSARIYFRILDSFGANLFIGLDPLGPAAKTGQVWSPGATPPTFTTPTTVGTGLAVATLNPGFVISVWVRRAATGGQARRPEKNTLTITGTTAA